ncbi:MAG: tRNA epoxyqueuosine(34) reductase QueG [Proteobacteria bacterium]|nr:tRNA epoxyqueuosine(34) reductase QueG [Pseudomonadota bacterium]
MLESFFKKAGFVLAGVLNRGDAVFGNWLEPWLNRGYHADMSWMEKNASIRRDPCSIEAYGKSILSLAYPYFTEPPEIWGDNNPISNYAWGEDYHKVLQKLLKHALNEASAAIPGFLGRSFVDTAPIPEKVVAALSGVGWIGRNGMLIHRQLGSYLFLAEVVCNLDLPSTPPAKDYCGKCTLCLESCPTQAILADRTIDSRRCISYLTIEKRGEYSKREEEQVGYHLFGCDICQQVCPWNRKVQPIRNSPFECSDKWLKISLEELADVSETRFEHLKRKSPLKRAKLEGIRRNARAVLKNRRRTPSTMD